MPLSFLAGDVGHRPAIPGPLRGWVGGCPGEGRELSSLPLPPPALLTPPSPGGWRRTTAHRGAAGAQVRVNEHLAAAGVGFQVHGRAAEIVQAVAAIDAFLRHLEAGFTFSTLKTVHMEGTGGFGNKHPHPAIIQGLFGGRQGFLVFKGIHHPEVATPRAADHPFEGNVLTGVPWGSEGNPRDWVGGRSLRSCRCPG